MANNYYEGTGVLVLERVTPVIKALFGAFALDEGHPGNGQAYIAQIAETTNPQWPDVLDGLESVSLCTGYMLDGKKVDLLPYGYKAVEKAEPILETMPGWTDSTVGVKEYDKLPENARRFLARIEEICEVPVDIISTGPDRMETILRRHPFLDQSA